MFQKGFFGGTASMCMSDARVSNDFQRQIFNHLKLWIAVVVKWLKMLSKTAGRVDSVFCHYIPIMIKYNTNVHEIVYDIDEFQKSNLGYFPLKNITICVLMVLLLNSHML